MAAPRKPAAAQSATTRKPRATSTRKTEEAPKAPSLDDLLEHDENLAAGGPDAPAVTEEPAAAPDEAPHQDKPENSADGFEDVLEDEEIERLRAELEEANKARLAPTAGGRPLSEEQLTPKQKEIRALRDQVAQAKAKAFEASDLTFEDASSDSVRTIHFVADGFTVQGRTWLTGQTVDFGPEAYEQTKDRFGNSWLDLSEADQYEKYGRVYFREGPWRGARYDDDAAAEDRRRGNAAPLITI